MRVAPLSALCILVAICALSPALAQKPDLILATTTSARDSGLYDVILPAFQKATGINVGVVAVGTGKALTLGENGDADLLLVHDPEREKEFVEKGFGIHHTVVMHNFFIVLGPPDDPADISKAKTAAEAFARIAKSGALFVSRGDDSGTNAKELSIWKAIGAKPAPDSYRETGQGMGPTIKIADELSAYTLSDKATFLTYRSKLRLRILFEKDKLLLNPYSVMAVNPERHPHVKYAVAMRFIEWLTSLEGQRIIAGYRADGEQLFWPDVHPELLKEAEPSQPSPTSPSLSPKPSG